MLLKNLVLHPLPGAYSPVFGWLTYMLPVRADKPCMSGAGGMISAGDPPGAQGTFTRALHKGLLMKTMMASAWAAGGGEGPHKHPSPQAAHLPCRLTAVRSPSSWGPALAGCVCRPENSLFLSVRSLLVMTPNTFLGNLPLMVLSVEMQQEQN